jgi:hypothetical protein
MNTIPVSKIEVLEDFPIVEEWLQNIKGYLKKDINEDKLQFFYTFGFFVPKVSDREEMYLKMYEDCSTLKYVDRLNFEMSKVRVSLTIKIGNFMMADRLPKGIVPQVIQDIVAEITKVKMIVESEYHEDKEIIESIPELNRDIVSFDTIRDYVKDDLNEELELDLDSILDKISSDGFDSLSDEEKEFLDKKSKGI